MRVGISGRLRVSGTEGNGGGDRIVRRLSGGNWNVKEALYEAVMQDAERYEDLARRAESSEDDELAEFFREIRDENRRRAERAERLLAGRLAE